MPAITVTPLDDVMFTALKALLTTLSGFDTDHIVKRAMGSLSMPTSPFIQMTGLDSMNLGPPVVCWDTTNPTTPVAIRITEDTSNRVQIDFVGIGSKDLANIFCTVFTSQYGVSMLGPQCAPLQILSRIMVPLETAEQTTEERWIVRVSIEYKPAVSVPQQFATAAVPSSTIVDSSEL